VSARQLLEEIGLQLMALASGSAKDREECRGKLENVWHGPVNATAGGGCPDVAKNSMGAKLGKASTVVLDLSGDLPYESK
jgi:hypothetical protein